MNALKLLLLASLSIVFPILLGFTQMMIILLLQAILEHYRLEVISYFVPLCIGVIYLICVWLFLKWIFNMRNAILAGLCPITAFIGAGFCAFVASGEGTRDQVQYIWKSVLPVF